MNEEEKINPRHMGIRSVLRIAGPILLLTGLLLTLVGVGSFFSSFGTFGPPKYFWCAFLGLPLIFLGVVTTAFAYMGAMARFQAGEVAPVAKDTFNYMAHGTRDGIQTMASAVGSGLAEGMSGVSAQSVRCHKCNHLNDHDAKFCDECGTALLKEHPCPSCNELNDHDAKFCDNCGQQLGV